MKKRLFSIALCLAFILSTISVSTQDAAYKEALNKILEASGAMTIVRSMVPQMIGMMKHTYSSAPDEFWKTFEEQLSEGADTQFMNIYVSTYYRYLTINDLKKITQFYGSPVGKKLAESTPVMTAEAIGTGQQIRMGAVQEIVANLEEKGYIQWLWARNLQLIIMYRISDLEIMAPVSSCGSFVVATQAGAGSIYSGIGNLGMCARSANTFTIEDLRGIARTCDEHGVKSYLMVGTIVYDKDVELMRIIVDVAKEVGILTMIAADAAVVSYASKTGQGVHPSMQLSISSVEALKSYVQLAGIVVLTHELDPEQVAEIYRRVQEEHICRPGGELIRIEVFYHGVLCMTASGRCYLSLHEMNHSTDRKACMQICRRSYTVRGKDTGVELEIGNQYTVSPKDLKTAHFMNKIMNVGAYVFKIKDRARGPEYIRTVVECCKQAIQTCLDGTFTDGKITAWDKRLKTVFDRGLWDGYYLGQRLGEWTKNYGSAVTERKIYVEKGIRYLSDIGIAEFLAEAAEVGVDDKLLITDPTIGAVSATFSEARVDLKPVETVKKGEHFSMELDEVRPGGRLCRLVPTRELKKFKGLE